MCIGDRLSICIRQDGNDREAVSDWKRNGGKKREGEKTADRSLPPFSSLYPDEETVSSNRLETRLLLFKETDGRLCVTFGSNLRRSDKQPYAVFLTPWQQGPALYANAGTWKAAISQESNLGENGGFFSFLKQLFLHDGAYRINSHARLVVFCDAGQKYMYL